MRVLCSTKSRREGGDKLIVAVEVAQDGPTVEVQEISMSEGWTGCRFSPCALWLALSLARDRQRLQKSASATTSETDRHRLRLLELGCGVGLAGFTAHALGWDTTLTDCLEGHLRNLEAQVVRRDVVNGSSDLRVRRLDWIEECQENEFVDLDRQSPENSRSAAGNWKHLEDSEQETFDLVVASDVLYEEHHAILLPLVIKRWLRPGGIWILTFAIRDAGMLVRFLHKLCEAGLMVGTRSSAEAAEVFALSLETACVPEQCDFCRCHSDASCGKSSTDEKIALEGKHRQVTFAFLESLILGHEGGAIALEGRRPVLCT